MRLDGPRLPDRLLRRSPGNFSDIDRLPNRQTPEDVLVEPAEKPSELRQGQTGQRLFGLDAVRHDPPHDPVGHPKRHPLHDQVFGHIRRRGEPSPRPGLHPLMIETQTADHGRDYLQAGLQGVDRIEERLLVFLKIPVVGHRQTLEKRQEGNEMPVHATRLAPDKLRHVGVLLLGHDAASRREGVRDLDVAELVGRPQDDVFAKTAQVHHDKRGGEDEFSDKVPI